MRGLPLCIAAEGVLGGVLIGQLVKNPWGGCKLGGGHQFGCLPYFHYTARLSFSCLVVVAQHAVWKIQTIKNVEDFSSNFWRKAPPKKPPYFSWEILTNCLINILMWASVGGFKNNGHIIHTNLAASMAAQCWRSEHLGNTSNGGQPHPHPTNVTIHGQALILRCLKKPLKNLFKNWAKMPSKKT